MNHPAPLQTNQATKEPFIRLRRHPNIVVTPPRLTDADALVHLLNDPRVHDWLKGPPYPYTQQDAESWLKVTTDASGELLGKLECPVVDGCPFSSLREISDDGTDTFIGSVTLDRWGYPLIRDEIDKKSQLVKENFQRAAGDPDIIWTIGDYLAPSHHGRGIMTDALDTLLHDWAIPRMKARHIIVTAFTGNVGSVRVFEKLGFTLRETLPDFEDVKGRFRGFHVLEWKMDATRAPGTS
ncbi:hypothetical protein PC9H_003245 [Pleurotus ostreatus]|uniref:N-acetyltransferase domain-containing protein n=1 Tax=Pleurotus ostreatus TaxID=5322 RepID=A0A8H7A1I2_PLEOS|nr:uncharacterized protein PC9H_003245 [Pleurotus ostreatus]KAF7436412.1 hypothetical protein PC9H_003245 [Pleurotus ostreatus]